MVKTKWNYSKYTEAVRLVHMARSIRKNFFQKKGFFVLPYLVRGNVKTIYFPDLPYKKIKNFWDRVTQKPEYSEKEEDKMFIEELVSLIPEQTIEYTKLQNRWTEIGEEVLKQLKSYLPDCFLHFKELEIRPTKYGTMSSSYSVFCRDLSRIIIYVREDMDASQIVEAILIDFFDRFQLMLESTWEECEAVMDFLISTSSLKKYFPYHQQTIEGLREKQLARYAQDSNQYLMKLGFKNETIFSVKNNKIFLRGIQIILSSTEQKILKLFIEKRKMIISYDELANLVWETDADKKYSLYALAKIIQRLRSKIEEHGVFGDIIQTQRGEGFILLD